MPGRVAIAVASPEILPKPYKLTEKKVMERVRRDMASISKTIARAKRHNCIAVAFPEDTLEMGEWNSGKAGNKQQVLRDCEDLLCNTIRTSAAENGIYVLVCLDVQTVKGIFNTSILVGRDGVEIGRYRKVHLPLGELAKEHGVAFPVYQTPELGGVGMSICYDMVFPESVRCLALGGADVVFQLSKGGASFGDADMNRAAHRTRANDNQVYLAIAWRGHRMVIAPSGEVLAEEHQADGDILVVEIDPFAGRFAGDSYGGLFADIRARLFRERQTNAYDVLTSTCVPALAKFKDQPLPSREEAIRVAAGAKTKGKEDFAKAEDLLEHGKKQQALSIFRELITLYPRTWIDWASRDRLKKHDCPK